MRSYMFDFSEALIKKIIVHQVGNKLKEEELILSSREVAVNENGLANILQRYFFQSFKDTDVFSFTHESDLKYNEVYALIQQIFETNDNFISDSRDIAKHLYEVSTHPNIRGGELYIVCFERLLLEARYCNAVGIFKSENKDAYLKTENSNSGIAINWDTGTNPNKLDKGCIIFELDKECGYKAIVVDTKSKDETKYWVKDFLNLTKVDSAYCKTKIIADACKKFVKTDFKGDASEKAVALNNVLNYISTNDTMDIDAFATELRETTPSMEGIGEYIKEYAERQDISDIATFALSPSAVKNVKKSIRNLIKLDTQIEIRLTTPSTEAKRFIERGFDSSKQMYYYKVYFNEEQ